MARDRDWVSDLDAAIAASGMRLVYDPRNWVVPHTVRGRRAADPVREHPEHIGQTCDEYDAEPAEEDAEDAPCKTCGKPWRTRRHECQAEPADGGA